MAGLTDTPDLAAESVHHAIQGVMKHGDLGYRMRGDNAHRHIAAGNLAHMFYQARDGHTNRMRRNNQNAANRPPLRVSKEMPSKGGTDAVHV